MADLFKTNLILIGTPLPADFEGTPQEMFEAFVERLEIQSPVGTNFFVVGDIEPSSDQGPWLKGGTQWWVFSPTRGEYVPLDISASTARLFTVGPEEPAAPGEDEATIWLRTSVGRVIGWYFWTGAEWRPGGNVSARGTTEFRPQFPVDYEQFFDTSINTLIQWERGAWRTVSGVPGDVKFVVTPTLVEALTNNPGWIYLGNIDQNFIGRVIGIAAKDQGATPASSFSTASGITAQAAGDILGEETHVLESDEIEQHTHLIGSLAFLHSGNRHQFYRVDDGETFSAPSPRPPNHANIPTNGSTDATETGELPVNGVGTMLVSSKQLSIETAPNYTTAAEPHENRQPTLFLWALTKQ